MKFDPNKLEKAADISQNQEALEVAEENIGLLQRIHKLREKVKANQNILQENRKVVEGLLIKIESLASQMRALDHTIPKNQSRAEPSEFAQQHLESMTAHAFNLKKEWVGNLLELQEILEADTTEREEWRSSQEKALLDNLSSYKF